MVRDTNSEHVLAEEGSSSHPKRQPLSSLVEDEAETVQEAEGGENCEEGTVSSDRSRIMERVVEAVTVPCPTVKHGCTNKFSTSLMAKSWPMRRNVVLLYATVLHQTATTPACMNIRDRILFLQESIDGPLVAVHCFEEEQGVYVTVNCIAPCALRASAMLRIRIEMVSPIVSPIAEFLAMLRKASRSRTKGQRLSSLVEDEAESVEVEAEPVEEVLSGTLLDLDLLDCPVCCHALTNPIFQCDNGHIACSSCCTNLRNKCPSCTLPIGACRKRIMERVVEAVTVPCLNAKHGCTEKFSYGKELVHEKECSSSLCYCPARGCNYVGMCNDLYRHYFDKHSRESYREGPLVAVQCFEEEQGLYVTVNCIAPCTPGVSEFSFQLTYSPYEAPGSMSFGLSKMNRIQKVSFQTPDKDFMFIPHYFLAGRPNLKIKIA
uniref:RING-type E3 ubiquitin transferase n=1 Tax=Brassica oleracea var. oleracea TaxID=109376 RepID=A0A0D3CZC2_BRAOL